MDIENNCTLNTTKRKRIMKRLKKSGVDCWMTDSLQFPGVSIFSRLKRRKKKKSKSPSRFLLRFQYIPKLDGHRKDLYFKCYKNKEDHEKAKTELDRLLDDGFTRLQVYRIFRDSKRRKKKSKSPSFQLRLQIPKT